MAEAAFYRQRSDGTNVGEKERWLSMVAGAMLAAWGLQRRDTVGGAAGVGAAALLYRGATGHCHVYDALGVNHDRRRGTGMLADQESDTRQRLGGQRGIHVEESVTVNRPIAEAMYENIKKVGLPQWSEDDQTLAKGLQKELKVPVRGLATRLSEMRAPRTPTPAEEGPGGQPPQPTGGGSDDIGDVSWNVPTVTLRYPSNIPAGPGHNWADAIAMATPIAHKGVVAGAKVQAMTALDFMLKPELVKQAWDYFNNVQTKEIKYRPLINPSDQPAIELNKEKMEKFAPQLKKYHYDPAKYKTYLEQLGIQYPTVRK